MKILTLEILNAVDIKVTDKNYYDEVWWILSYPIEVKRLGSREIIYKSFLDRRGGKFPTGLLSVVKAKLEKKGILVKVKKPKIKILEPEKDFPYLLSKLDDYQKDAMIEIEKHQRGLIVAATGAGKTLLQAAIIDTYGTPATLIIVPSRDIAYQTKAVLEKELSLKKVGLLGDSTRDTQHITIALYQTLARYELDKINELFDMVLVDEIHTGRSDSYQIILNQLTKIHYRYGFTATMRLGQPDRYIIQGLIGPPIAIVEEQETTKRVTDVKMYMIKYSNKLLGDEYYYPDKVKDNIWLSTERNKLIADIVNFIVKKLKKNILVMVEKYQQADSIKRQILLHYTSIQCPILFHGTSNEDREMYKDQLDKKKIMCLIATPAVSIGSNIPNIEFLLIASEIKSWLPLTQKIGRGRRRTNKKSILYAIDIFTTLAGDWTFRRQSMQKMRFYKKKGWLEGIFTFGEFRKEMKRVSLD